MPRRRHSLTIVLLLVMGALFSSLFIVRRTGEGFAQPREDSGKVERLRARETQFEPQVVKAKSEETQVSSSARPSQSAAPARTDDFQAPLEAQSVSMWKFKVPRLTPEETFSKRLIELFGVNQTDVNAFLGVVNSTRTLLAQHAQETATIVHADAASVVLTVPPTEQAQKIHDVLMALIQDVLQKDHAAASQL